MSTWFASFSCTNWSRPDTKDYVGNLPVFYSVMNNDAQMIVVLFPKGKQYFHLRNFKNQSLFHVAAKRNALDALSKICEDKVFFEQLLQRDYKGDTPLHAAAKNGSADILEFFLTRCTPAFLELENDFGLTPAEAAREKLKLAELNEADLEESKDPGEETIGPLKQCDEMLRGFTDWAREDRWPFAIKYSEFARRADSDLLLFLGF